MEKLKSPAFKIAISYLLISFLWILTSDKIIYFFIKDIEDLNFIQTIKGWFFISITALLLYLLIKKYLDEEKALRQRVENIFNNTGIPIVVFSEDGKSLQINKAWQELSGYSLDEIDTFEKWSNMAYRENVKKYANIVKSYYDTNKRVDLGDFEIKTKDNRTLIWHCTLAPFGLINGKKVFISTALDITELTEKNKLLIQQSKMATMGEMIGNIAHQWKQPLSLIRASNGLIKLNREYGNFEDQIDKALVDIDSSVENLSSTIDDFRNFFDPNKSVNNFDIKDTFEKTFKLIKSQFSNNDIKIISNINNITVLGLENELLQVLINIIKNAKEQLLEINKDSEKLLFVDTSCDKNNLLILIKDNAQGVPLEIIDKIFDSYFTTKAIDGGTGIGLSMSKQIIESNMHGSLKVFNEEYKYQDKEYKGAVFKIKIPLLYLNGKVKI
jgi:PAS domain S-box-containing protein